MSEGNSCLRHETFDTLCLLRECGVSTYERRLNQKNLLLKTTHRRCAKRSHCLIVMQQSVWCVCAPQNAAVCMHVCIYQTRSGGGGGTHRQERERSAACVL